ncbi:uncharacterized protein METZ01_LOCUS361377, partial [marine metagenome]
PWGHRQEGESTVWIPQQSDNAAALGPAGTVHCSIYDWAKFIELQFANKTPAILDRAKLNELITPTTGNYAAGWAKHNRTWAGPGGVALQHTGSNTMWYVNLWIAPALDRAFLAGANAKNADSFAMSDDVIWSLINHESPDAGNETPSFTLVAGSGSTHNHLFNIDANGTLKTAAVLNYEANATLSIRVRATDEHNASLEKTFTIAVLDDPADNNTSVAGSNATVPDDNSSAQDTNATVPDGNATSVSDENESVIVDPVYQPIVRTLPGIVEADGKLRLSGRILTDGGSPVTEVGFLLSRSLRIDPNDPEVVR